MKSFYRLISVDDYENTAEVWVAGYKRTLRLDEIIKPNLNYLLAIGSVAHAKRNELDPDYLEDQLYKEGTDVPRRRQPNTQKWAAAKRLLDTDDEVEIRRSLDTPEFVQSRAFQLELANVRHERTLERLEEND